MTPPGLSPAPSQPGHACDPSLHQVNPDRGRRVGLGATPARWFAPGFQDREPARAAALLQALFLASDDGYAAVCHALQAYDVRDRLGEIAQPVVAVAGRVDPVCPPDLLQEIADGVQHGRLVVLDDVAHQAPAEAPEQVSRIIRELAQEVAA